MLNDSPGALLVPTGVLVIHSELSDLLGLPTLHSARTATALLGISPHEFLLLAHRTNKSKELAVKQLT